MLNAPASVEFEVQRVAEIMRRFLGLSRCISIRDFFSGWFHGAPYEAIHRGNVKDFVAYGFYCKTTEQLPPAVGTLLLTASSVRACMHALPAVAAVRAKRQRMEPSATHACMCTGTTCEQHRFQ